MKDVHYFILKKDRFNDFIAGLAGAGKVAAPVSRGEGQFAFQEVTSGDEVAVRYIPTILPPKKYFMPQKETLLEYRDGANLEVTTVVDCESTTLFGVHTCDLAGIQCLNAVFSDRPKDFNYLVRKSKVRIIGLECNEYCDEYASCSLVGAHQPSGGYDLFFTDLGDLFAVHVNTHAGDEMIRLTGVFEKAEPAHLETLDRVRRQKAEVFRHEVPIEPRLIPEVFDREFESPVWKELEERCLACGNCTNVCPTCYCFDLRDEANLDLHSGTRYRVWDSCQLEPFAKVAGGENFRKARAARQRHRYYRKFRYPMDRFGRFFCTGCGRCSRTCMAEIKLKETLNALIKESEAKRWKGWL
jgi:sulfhydrogenase subunit beta (sulfur reductase)